MKKNRPLITVGSLFSGVEGLGLGLAEVLPIKHLWVSDNAPASSHVLRQRFPGVPNLGDITQIEWEDVEPVSILTGGFPCQDLSHAGLRIGLGGSRSGLWQNMKLAVQRLHPELVIIENVGALRSGKTNSNVEPCPSCVGEADPEHRVRALGAVLADLACIGYDAQWTSIRASDAGAPHQRLRVVIIAWPIATYPDKPAWIKWWKPASRQTKAGWARTNISRPDRAFTANPNHARLQGPQSATGCDVPDGGNYRSIHTDWGRFAKAIQRWEEIKKEQAPEPTMTSVMGNRVLSPAFVEWMMGLPKGHVTDVLLMLSRNEQLRLLGNVFQPQQAAMALRELFASAAVTL